MQEKHEWRKEGEWFKDNLMKKEKVLTEDLGNYLYGRRSYLRRHS
jgi:hypothetical protein